MVTAATSTAEHREHDKSVKSPVVVVDLGKRQSRKQISRLRKGEGKLLTRVERIVNDLVEAGTVKATAQAVVIVVREDFPVPWPFDQLDD
jgi:hypothetical protein